MNNDISYLRRRASDERTAAMHAPDARVRRIHEELAERYEDTVRALVREQTAKLHLVG